MTPVLASRARPRHRIWELFLARLDGLDLDENTILLAFGLAIGTAGALGVILFFRLIDLSFWLLYRLPVAHIPFLTAPIYRPMTTALGFALAAWLVRRFGQGEEGPNIPYVQLAVARRGGHIPTRPGLVHAAASAVTLGSGGSAGAEGPVAVLGATVGASLGRLFRFDSSRIKVLVASGAAAGIAASFNAPLTGAFFAIEEILGSLSTVAFPAVVVSSVTAALIARAVLGNQPSFPVPIEYGYTLGREVLLFFPLLGALAGFTGALFVRSYFAIETLARRSGVHSYALPLIGGATVGLLVLVSGGVLVGYGHLAARPILFGRAAFWLLALLAIGKIVATSITLNFGGSGGVFTPSLYVGAVTGGAFGAALVRVFPGWGLQPEAYALVGMGAVVAAATHAPITAILIVFEMTNDYAIVLPLMPAVVISYLIARRLEPDSLYSGWLSRRGERIEHGADRDLLAHFRAADALLKDARVVPEHATAREVLESTRGSEQLDVPVIGEDGRLVGMIRTQNLVHLGMDYGDVMPVLVAADLAEVAEAVAPGASLAEVMRRMGVRGVATLPVTDPGSGRFLGLITRAHIISLYERALADRELGATATSV